MGAIYNVLTGFLYRPSERNIKLPVKKKAVSKGKKREQEGEKDREVDVCVCVCV